MKLLQVNTTLNTGSTGRIAEDIGLAALAKGYKSFIAAGDTNRPSSSEVIQIGNKKDKYLHGLKTRIWDRHGFGSVKATEKFVSLIKTISPDLIHLHNIHGYFLNVDILFQYLKEVQKPVVWTFHDCWPFTGHCSYFDDVNCYKWKSQCYSCPNKKGYPATWVIDNSAKNFKDKKVIFNGLNNMHIVCPSKWLTKYVNKSFLQDYPVSTIHNGINLNVFQPKNTNVTLKRYGISGKIIILGVANTWRRRKALDDFIQLSTILSSNMQIVLVGLAGNQAKTLPENIKAIPRTERIEELAELYSASDVFLNPTYVDNFPTTNIEALACGTAVVTYDTGGSTEAIDDNTGIVVEKGNIEELAKAIYVITNNGKEHYQTICRERAEQLFDKNERFNDYLKLYDELLEK